ncbi:MAG: histidine kinase [bacterium]
MNPSDPPRDRSRWHATTFAYALVVVLAIVLGMLALPPQLPGGVSIGRTFPRTPGPPPNFRTLLYLLGVGSAAWYATALAFPFLLWGARRIDIGRRHRLHALGVTVSVVVALFALTSVGEYFIAFQGAPNPPGFASYLPLALRTYLLPWVAVIGIVSAIEARRRAHVAALERERLRAQVAEQRLIALTGQLHPHFLFNTLQGISTLIHRDAEAADEMLATLSDLLRELLRHRDHVLVRLDEELRYTRSYLEISQMRFSDRLRFEIDAPPDLLHAAVPLFILQPLVENAVTHGIGSRARGGRIVVSVSRAGDRITLQVVDDGAGLGSGVQRDGVGLGNTRERLLASYGQEQSLTLTSEAGGGTRAVVVIPFRPLEREAERE